MRTLGAKPRRATLIPDTADRKPIAPKVVATHYAATTVLNVPAPGGV